MGFFEKFKNTIEPSELKRKKSHLKNMYSIALADGRLANEEHDYILSAASRLYVSIEVLQNVLNFPDDISFYVPENDREKLDQIHDCVCVALIDGEINNREIAMCKLIAAKLGFRPIVVDHIVEDILQSVIRGIASEVALAKLLKEI
jgi:tellurite resistance protein